MKAKKGSISYYKFKLDPIFKKFIRIRDGRCMKCGTTEHIQCSHTIPTSSGNRLRYDERNCITLCLHCHLSWWHKNPLEAMEWFKDTFPEDYEYLMSVKNETLKFSFDMLRDKLAYYTEKIMGGQ